MTWRLTRGAHLPANDAAGRRRSSPVLTLRPK